MQQVDTEEQKENVLVELRPFAHQAGGHTAVLELNKSTICKPYEEREVWFYENEPAELMEFTPKYLGETEVSCQMCQDRLYLSAAVPKTFARQRGLAEFNPRTPMTPDSSMSTPPVLTRKKSRKRCLSPDEPLLTNDTKSDVTSCLEVWSIKCIERQIDRYGFWANNQPQKFIMLENLVHTYRKPCLMDLKMGRRQFGDDSSAEKKQLLHERCAQTTSASLGFRICGTQLYMASTDQYCVRDKYVGRDLDNHGAVEEIKLFFSNGIVFRQDAVIEIIEKLRRLKSTIIECDTLNFFSCSLLLIYEGHNTKHSDSEDTETSVQNDSSTDDNVEGSDIEACVPTVDVRLIDFAHVSEKSVKGGNTDTDNGNNSRHTNDDDRNFDSEKEDTIIFGIEKILDILENLVSSGLP